MVYLKQTLPQILLGLFFEYFVPFTRSSQIPTCNNKHYTETCGDDLQ